MKSFTQGRKGKEPRHEGNPLGAFGFTFAPLREIASRALKRFRPTGCPASCPVGRRTLAGKLQLYLSSEAVRTFTGVLLEI